MIFDSVFYGNSNSLKSELVKSIDDEVNAIAYRNGDEMVYIDRLFEQKYGDIFRNEVAQKEK